MKLLYIKIMVGIGVFCLLVAGACFLFVLVAADAPGHPCVTPNQELATCQLWYNCTIILKSLVAQEPSAKRFAEESKCGETPLVCCGSIGNFASKGINVNQSIANLEPYYKNVTSPNNDTKEAKRAFALMKLLPSTKFCGLQHTDDYFYNKTETSIDEFPWLVYIAFRKPIIEGFHKNKIDFRCTGFLISNRYVITEQFCDAGAPELVKKVYIGQYHRKQNVSCVRNVDLGLDECTEPLLEVNVTESVSPDPTSVYISNIKLLRLEKKVFFTDYVRPICLPLDESKRAKVGDTVVTSGWGAQSFNVSGGTIKKRYKHTLESIALEGDDTTSMTASPQKANETVCPGDGGGPLMFSYKHQWFAEGVIDSDGTAISCDDPSENMYATRITPLTIEWILLNMKP